MASCFSDAAELLWGIMTAQAAAKELQDRQASGLL